MKNEPIISAIICTYNGGTYLKHSIKSLLNQSLSKEKYEIIIIDNNSTEDIKKIVKKYKDIKYFLEKRNGLSNARNLGIKKAKGKYIAYLDDDAIASKDWLKEIIYSFEEIKPTPMCVGGQISLLLEKKRPKWLSNKIIKIYGKLKLKNGFLKKHFLYGSNFAFNKSVFDKIGSFSRRFGLGSEKNLLGEDDEIQLRLIRNNFKIYYYSNIKTKHIVKKSKMNKKWIEERFQNSGITRYELDLKLNYFIRFKKIILESINFIRNFANKILNIFNSNEYFFYSCNLEENKIYLKEFFRRLKNHIFNIKHNFAVKHEFPKEKVLYIEVPKAGCTSIKYSLKEFKGDWTKKAFKKIHNWYGYEHIKTKDLKKEFMSKYKDWTKFTVVRNPYQRFISLFKDKNKVKEKDFKKYVKTFKKNKRFEEHHGCPQTNIVGKDLSIFDFVGRTENMDEVFKFLSKTFNKKIQPIKLNKNSEPKVLMTKNLRKQIYELFKEDFKILEYDK
ncbi:glycosyltransferase [Candidatus Woesearchaeota archaeon]|nr:glycosyltransferase [Candidatus Woesearchaeota archaeon]